MDVETVGMIVTVMKKKHDSGLVADSGVVVMVEERPARMYWN